MRSTQKLVLGEIQKTVETLGLNFSEDRMFGNTGNVYVRKGLKTICNFHYDFQDGYFSINFNRSHKQARGGMSDYDVILCLKNTELEKIELIQTEIENRATRGE